MVKKQENMVRTYLHITPVIDKKISVIAKSANKPKAVILREALDIGLEELNGKQKPQGTLALLKMIEAAEKLSRMGGPKDLATNHDFYTWDD